MNYSPTYSDLYDPAFPQSLLDTRVELQLAGVWTDVSQYVYERDQVTVAYGHPDETQAANPTSCRLTLNNRDGRFSPRNPVGAFYGPIGRNTPMRVSLPEGSVYLRLEDDRTSYASCPNRASLGITGDIDIRIDLEPTDYQQTVFAGKWNSATNQRSWAIGLNSNGQPFFAWSSDGTSANKYTCTCSATMPLGRGALKVTFAVATSTCTFYSAPSIAGPWTQLGVPQVRSDVGSTSIFASTASIAVGYNANFAEGYLGGGAPGGGQGPTGKVFAFNLLSGIGGTVVASPAFTAQVPGTAPFADAQANLWSCSGTAQLSDRKYRAHTEVPAWPPRWDPTGTDVYAPIEGSGLLRRYTQGTPPVFSALYRGYTLLAGALAPVAYWPCEDGAQSATIASALTGAPPMAVTGTPGFAGNSAFVCSKPLPTLNGSSWIAAVPAAASWSANIIRFLMQVPSGGDTDGATVARVQTTGTIARMDLVYNTAFSGELTLKCYNGVGSLLQTVGPMNYPVNGVLVGVNGQLARVDIDLQKSGSNVTAAISALVVGQSAGGVNSATVASASIGAVTAVVVNEGSALQGTSIGHLSVQSTWDSLFDVAGPLQANIGETAAVRFARLCAEQGVACRVYGIPTDTVPMGYQTPSDFVSLLQECEDADKGLVFEPRETLGLGYRTRPSMFNQAAKLALAYTSAQLSAPVEPTDDDLLIQNDLTVTRKNASSVRNQQSTGALSAQPPPGGAGDYGQSVSVSLGADAQLPDAAGWRLLLGTVDDVRYPSLSVDLSRSELAAVYYQAQDVRVGDRVTVASTPAWLPPDGISQIVRGGTEVCYGYIHTEQWVCVPESPYRVALFDDAVLGHGDTDGSTLYGPVYSPTAVSLQVATTGAATGSPLWTTSGGDFPFDIIIAGERMTVTNITGSSSPQAFTVTRSVNGVVKTQYPGADVRLFQPAILSM